jgi:hypothetical protein
MFYPQHGSSAVTRRSSTELRPPHNLRIRLIDILNPDNEPGPLPMATVVVMVGTDPTKDLCRSANGQTTRRFQVGNDQPIQAAAAHSMPAKLSAPCHVLQWASQSRHSFLLENHQEVVS